MPELPEVETVVRALRPRVQGRTIDSLRVGRKPLRKRWRPAWKKLLLGRRIEAIERRGKWIVCRLDHNLQLVFHLGMTGQLCVVAAEEPLRPHTHLVFELGPLTSPVARGAPPSGQSATREQLRFRDVRRFGSATLFDDPSSITGFFSESRLGPEPFDLEAKYFRERLLATRRCLKAILLDQRVVAGVGNIYADEALFEARLPPTRLGCDMTGAEANRLRRAVVVVLNRAIDKRGSSIRDYVDGSGAKGEYQREFRVYGQVGRPCPRCRVPIERIRLAGRSTHFCPQCQHVSAPRWGRAVPCGSPP